MSGSTLFLRQCRQLRSLSVLKQRSYTVLRNVRLGRVNVALPQLNHHINCHRLMSQESRVDGVRPDTKHVRSNSTDSQENEKKVKQTSRQKLTLVFAKYGVTAVVFHTVISITSLGLCYVAVSSGLDIPSFLIKMGASESFSSSVAAKGASTFVIAYACHKIFMPVRIFLTVTCTPLIVHRLQQLGLVKAR